MAEGLRSLLTRDLPVVDGVHVAESDDAHVGSFSDEWTRWATTQVDSRGYRCGYEGCRNSAEAFAQKTGLGKADVEGRVVLDAGCGSGRYAEIAAKMGALVVAVDLSSAVFHAAKLGAEWKQDSLFVKADLERLPLRDSCVDVAYSIGVLHHCARPDRAVSEIARVLRPGGIFAGWVYERTGSYGHRLRAMWRSWSTRPENRPAALALAQAAPRLRDVYASGNGVALAALVSELGGTVPVLPTILALSDPETFREIIGISGSRNDDECRLDSFDWMTPAYQWMYDWNEWRMVLNGARFRGMRMLPFPISWRASR